MSKVINCPCGFLIRAESESDLVEQAQEHAQSAHEMNLTRDEALAMARPE